MCGVSDVSWHPGPPWWHMACSAGSGMTNEVYKSGEELLYGVVHGSPFCCDQIMIWAVKPSHCSCTHLGCLLFGSARWQDACHVRLSFFLMRLPSLAKRSFLWGHIVFKSLAYMTSSCWGLMDRPLAALSSHGMVSSFWRGKWCLAIVCSWLKWPDSSVCSCVHPAKGMMLQSRSKEDINKQNYTLYLYIYIHTDIQYIYIFIYYIHIYIYTYKWINTSNSRLLCPPSGSFFPATNAPWFHGDGAVAQVSTWEMGASTHRPGAATAG